MEKQKTRFDYSGYGDRVASSPKTQSVEQASWSLPPGELGKEITTALASLAPTYESIVPSEQPLAGWNETPLNGDPTILCTIYKRPYNKPGQTELALELKRTGENHVYFAAFYFKHRNEYPWTWELSHREVSPAYRDKRIFSEVLPALENFVQEFGNHKQAEQTIALELGQPMVVARFLNKGYSPSSASTQKTEAMLDGSDPNYFCEYAHARSPRTEEILRMDDIDPFCFDARLVDRSKIEQLTPGNAVRVTIEKKFPPKLHATPQISDETRNKSVRLIS